MQNAGGRRLSGLRRIELAPAVGADGALDELARVRLRGVEAAGGVLVALRYRLVTCVPLSDLLLGERGAEREDRTGERPATGHALLHVDAQRAGYAVKT